VLLVTVPALPCPGHHQLKPPRLGVTQRPRGPRPTSNDHRTPIYPKLHGCNGEAVSGLSSLPEPWWSRDTVISALRSGQGTSQEHRAYPGNLQPCPPHSPGPLSVPPSSLFTAPAKSQAPLWLLHLNLIPTKPSCPCVTEEDAKAGRDR
jgi:hypothetical protein